MHLLKRVDFNAIVDNSALTHIIKSKTDPATTRIKRLLELISSHSFNFYYMKGKDSVVGRKHGLYVSSPGSIPTAITTMTAAGGDAEHVSLNH